MFRGTLPGSRDNPSADSLPCTNRVAALRAHRSASPSCVLVSCNAPIRRGSGARTETEPEAHLGRTSQIHCRGERSPKSTPLDRRSSCQGTCGQLWASYPQARHIIGFRKPVGPFVEGLARHHPERANRPATALQRFGPAPAGSYSGHSPTRPHLNHPRTTRGHRGATPAAIELPRFVVDSVRLVTSVVGFPTGKSPCARPSRGTAVSAALAWRVDFGGTNTEASPYPSVTGLFPVRHRPRSDSLASRFRPLVVELFAVGCFAPTPAADTAGPACCHDRNSPRQRG